MGAPRGRLTHLEEAGRHSPEATPPSGDTRRAELGCKGRLYIERSLGSRWHHARCVMTVYNDTRSIVRDSSRRCLIVCNCIQ